MNRIIVERGVSKKLQGIFGVCHVTVRKALKGEKDGDLYMRIRKAALENNGKEMVEV